MWNWFAHFNSIHQHDIRMLLILNWVFSSLYTKISRSWNRIQFAYKRYTFVLAHTHTHMALCCVWNYILYFKYSFVNENSKIQVLLWITEIIIIFCLVKLNTNTFVCMCPIIISIFFFLLNVLLLCIYYSQLFRYIF